MSRQRQASRQIDRRGGLADATFLIGDGDDTPILCHIAKNPISGVLKAYRDDLEAVKRVYEVFHVERRRQTLAEPPLSPCRPSGSADALLE